PVKLPRLYARHKYVPIVGGEVGGEVERNRARRVRVAFAIKKDQLDAGGASRKNTEIDAARDHRSAKWRAFPRTHRDGGVRPSDLGRTHGLPPGSFSWRRPSLQGQVRGGGVIGKQYRVVLPYSAGRNRRITIHQTREHFCLVASGHQPKHAPRTIQDRI